MRMAHSTTVTPFLSASSLTSRSRVCSRIRASAVMCSDRRKPSSSSTGRRCTSEGWHDARTDSSGCADADATLVDAPSDTTDGAAALYSVPLGPPGTEGDVGGAARRWGFWGVVGWEEALAVWGVADRAGKVGCNGEREILRFGSQRRVWRERRERNLDTPR